MVHVGCHRNVSLIGTRQSGESKTAASVVLSAGSGSPAWAGEPRYAKGRERNPRLSLGGGKGLRTVHSRKGGKGSADEI